MKKAAFLLLIFMVLFIVLMSSCFRGEKEKSLIVDNVKLLLEDNTERSSLYPECSV